ncbi:MAG TPA: FAD-dependent oxidoreductase, partial [Terriglobia bacterium]|nr:FAD-dependent oxidoreductase [Terriglobia bacterium]
KLIGFRNRLIVLINWAWDYFLFERMVRLILPSASCREPVPPHPVPSRQYGSEAAEK